MFPLRLAGIDMSDDASKTLGGGVRAFLGTGGFLVMMFGGYFLYDNRNFGIGIPLIAVGLPIFISPWVLDRIIARIRSQLIPKNLEYLPYEDFKSRCRYPRHG